MKRYMVRMKGLAAVSGVVSVTAKDEEKAKEMARWDKVSEVKWHLEGVEDTKLIEVTSITEIK